ncbi:MULTISPECIES: FAD-dependent oxidoreductase [Streptomyces]|uniref:FAD-dependent oxidoreductase n=1 Tax=Streptomyces dengpaensis TaxID=2049881 RepID=A0ABM6SL49_9ACTN|nr:MULTISPECIES: FAD-dependent monooxygenase [Streptomyces]AVH55304.1 FAD-dependent oxidoreductase [Streptomyces dengpaensis]PIB06949.1 pyridine nucleotide-disulfide oxidoreductase [Streptomyces sp. HG99]
MNEPASAASRRAVVVGAGLAGLLAAAALHEYADVTVVERDALPDGPEPRKGLPQARHAHLLWSGGARAMEELLPGVTDASLAAGARRIPLPTGLVSMSAQGWLRRFPEMQFMIACSRDLLDSVVRAQLAQRERITLLQRTELLGLEGDASRVTGARIRTSGGEERVLEADLVVDASGRGSRASAWLEALGVTEAPMDEVDSGLAYASRIFRAPAGTADFPVVNVQPDAAQPVPGQSSTIVPIEGGRWLVTLSGTRGGQPTDSAEEFAAFARGVRHPVVGELIADAEPLTEVVLSRSTVNRRRFFEKVKDWPEGFVVLGDAVATYNPVYGHGMSVAAQGAVALRGLVAEHGPAAPGLARSVQRAVSRPVSTAWELATSTDIRYPGAIGKQPGAAQNLLGRYVNRLMLTATGRPLVTQALFSAMTLSGPLPALFKPEIALAVLRGPRLPALAEPPFTEQEREAVGAAESPTPS